MLRLKQKQDIAAKEAAAESAAAATAAAASGAAPGAAAGAADQPKKISLLGGTLKF